MSKKKKILIGLLLFLVVAQFFRIDKSNPEFDVKTDLLVLENAPDEIVSLMKSACYDCHSNETVYPWYTNIAPVSWWIKRHINNGRRHLNYSDWGNFSVDKRNHKIEESMEYIREAWMPIGSYKIAHAEARLTEDQRAIMLNWFASLKQNKLK